MLERIGNCRIVEEMASGGMAVVYRAIQDGLERTVAIKALKSAAATEEHLALRFEREAKSLAQLQHENIIHVYDFHRERGAMFIVMEYVQGIDLYDLLDRCRTIPYDVAAIIALQVARALDYVHYRGIVHRDIKPGNIMISRQGGVKVMDFGIVRDRRFDDLTETGTGIGTPAYMSPEQILGDPLDARSRHLLPRRRALPDGHGYEAVRRGRERSVMHKIRLGQHVRAASSNLGFRASSTASSRAACRSSRGIDGASAQHLVMALERFLAKHVAINYHSRLVEFLRDQGIVPAFEAEEYLNPKLVGGRQGAAASPNLVKQQTLRRGLFVQSGILAIVALMVGIMHIAPLGADHAVAQLAPPPAQGFVRVVVHPWGHIAVDGTLAGTTPMAKPLSLPAGAHLLTVTHDDFAPLQRRIQVPENSFDDPLVVRIDLQETGVVASDDHASQAKPDNTPSQVPEQPQ